MTSHAGILLFAATLSLIALPTLLVTWRRHHLSEQRSRTGYGRIALQASAAKDTDDSTISLWMRMAVTLIILLSALFLILSKQYDSEQQKWAFGVIGTVLGYWLKG